MFVGMVEYYKGFPLLLKGEAVSRRLTDEGYFIVGGIHECPNFCHSEPALWRAWESVLQKRERTDCCNDNSEESLQGIFRRGKNLLMVQGGILILFFT